jgi:protein-tyrosine-phosphatase
MEEFGFEDDVYTLMEFAGEEGEIMEPYGGDEQAYEASYTEVKDLLYKIKKRLQWN